MNTENNFAHFYTELSLNPDLPTLAERCKLLTKSSSTANHFRKRSPFAVASEPTWKR